MARIPDKDIERLKQEVALERMAEARGVVLRRRGEELVCLCPFHEDTDASLVINPEKNTWHCKGACQSGGSVIDWVMKAEGVSFRHAVELLRDGTLSLATEPGKQRALKRSTVRKLDAVVEGDVSVQEQLQQVIGYYHEILKQSPEALAYLEKRGLRSMEMIDKFRLGFSNRTLGYHLPERNRRLGKEIRGRLEEIGILRKSGHEHFRGSLVIPVIDEAGYVTEVYGRKISDRLRKGTPMHLYLPGPHHGVWNTAALSAGQEIILCESLIDALTFWCAGFRNVTASYGVEGFTDDHLHAFKHHKTERVLIAYDRNDAGDSAAASLAKKLMAEGMECFRIEFPKGMDANEYAVKGLPAERSLDVAIRKAVWIGKGERPETNSDPTETVDQIEPECREEIHSPPGTEEEERIVTDDDKPEPVVASPMPTGPSREVHAEKKENEVVIHLGDRRWRIRGLEKNLSYSLMKVNLLVSRDESNLFHVDTFDLYSARQRQVFLRQASEELGVKERMIKKDLGKVLLKLEELQEEQVQSTLKPKQEPAVTLSAKERKAALELLKDEKLLDRILEDFEKCGVVGEETNKLIGYLAAVSRKLEEPLAMVIQSSSAAGKSLLMEAILSFFPPEERVMYSAMTGQSLFYMGEADIKHKILAIAEEEGAERATYALKLLQSEGELTIASTGKDPSTGRLITQEYRVEGPVMIFLTTTAIEIDEELLGRCIVLTVDEEREQTRAIHRLQRESQTLEGLLARQDSEHVQKLHQDAQRLLRPLLVANPFANELTFLDSRIRTRRDHMKYLTLIRSIALLRQYQREIKRVIHQGKAVSYIEVTLDDIEVANRLSHQVLGRSLDELAPQTRRLLLVLDKLVSEQCEKLAAEREDYRFTRRDVREHTGFGVTQTRVHLDRLVELEYVLIHKGGRGQQFVYELLYQGQGVDGEPFAVGLNELTAQTWRGHDGPVAAGRRSSDRQVKSNHSARLTPVDGKTPKSAFQEENNEVSDVG